MRFLSHYVADSSNESVTNPEWITLRCRYGRKQRKHKNVACVGRGSDERLDEMSDGRSSARGRKCHRASFENTRLLSVELLRTTKARSTYKEYRWSEDNGIPKTKPFPAKCHLFWINGRFSTAIAVPVRIIKRNTNGYVPSGYRVHKLTQYLFKLPLRRCWRFHRISRVDMRNLWCIRGDDE